jgi:serine/threonine protein kinase
LADLLKLENFAPGIWFLPIARCLLQAIHFVHVQNLAHCDVHLGNVFVRFVPDEITTNEHAALTFKLGDFGLAKAAGTISAEGTFLNSIRPPEAVNTAEFGPVDHRVDIFQVGLILLQILHGRSFNFEREQILQGLPRQMAEELNSPLGEALSRMLRRHSQARTPNALQAWIELRQATSSG